jgi:DNA (cytosine-5)-methyltransferase 1
MITSGHLCSGYDGLGRGLSLHRPHEALWHAEADPDMTTVLAKYEPDVPNVGDLIAAPWRLAPTPDVVTAGIPCQPISGAGKGLGEQDARYLWPYAVEIFRIVRPPFILLENVQRLTSMKRDDGTSMLAKWLADLRDLRYAVTWTVIGACAVGAPHHRHRFYAWCAYLPTGHVPEARRIDTPCGAPRSGGRWLLPAPMARDGKAPGLKRMERGEAPWADLSTAVALLPTPLRADASGGGADPSRERDRNPNLRDVVNMLPTPAARDGGARGTPSREQAARRVADPMRSTNLEDAIALLPTPRVTDVGTPGRRSSDGWRPQLGQAVADLLPTPRASDGPNGGPNQRNGRGEYDALPGLVVNALPELWGKYADAVALWESITGIPAPEPTEVGSKGGRRLNPALPEWMMGLPPGLLTGCLPRNAALKAAGNGAVPLQAAAAQERLAA